MYRFITLLNETKRIINSYILNIQNIFIVVVLDVLGSLKHWIWMRTNFIEKLKLHGWNANLQGKDSEEEWALFVEYIMRKQKTVSIR